MFNLIRKDMLVVRFYYLFIVLYAIFFGFIMNNEASTILVGALSAIMLVMFSVSLETKSKSILFIGSLPVKRKQIVQAKYAVVIVFLIIGLFMSLLVHLVSLYVLDNPVEWTWMQASLTTGIVLLFASLFFPVYYWLGDRAAQVVSLLAIFLAVSVIVGMSGVMSEMTFGLPLDTGSPAAVLSVIVGGTLLLFVISYGLSQSLFRKKDMAG
ncbi:ABC-2 transporter permease [Paenibacillus tarimensis]|uniref:ABC-2 transporter permease n=1 Tax=Paenibacillus tarimensis TaxID=416012 RepID=UPI001F1A9796|nr:ABC-2 transporter permease [Paenibacillus tarimensis]MCF2945849.1 ABC-2 transporter permease [Paenibacillus tarimensis]